MGKVCELSKPSNFKEEQISDIWASQCVFLAQGMEIFLKIIITINFPFPCGYYYLLRGGALCQNVLSS